MVELLLATPLTVKRIVLGHFYGMARMFGMPLLLYLAAQVVAMVVVYQLMWGGAVTAATTPLAVFGVSGPAMFLLIGLAVSCFDEHRRKADELIVICQ